MTLLLDTQVLLFWLGAPERLSRRARQLISSEESKLLWSVASSWELAIKVALGKLRLPEEVGSYVASRLEANGIDVLPIQLRHAHHVAGLPHHHRDPFDRLLIAQAALEGIPIVTSDHEVFRKYRVEAIW
ncbi:MAG: type II toxin-antitoxin system VapC family toxin [Deltaproteobacteria bacterium]|nr:type II toxin-antitoxin system VapC family toxin [Deltaproteobacteria bacterium]